MKKIQTLIAFKVFEKIEAKNNSKKRIVDIKKYKKGTAFQFSKTRNNFSKL